MAFDGNLFYCGGTAFPQQYIALESYDYSDAVNDKEADRSETGKLFRTVYDNQTKKIELKTVELNNEQLHEVLSVIQGAYTNPAKRELPIRVYDVGTDSYYSATFYVQSVLKYSIKKIDPITMRVIYKPMDIHFIEC